MTRHLRPVATPRVVSLRRESRRLVSKAMDALLARNVPEWTRLRKMADALDDEAREIDDERAAADRQAVARGCEAVLRWAATDGCVKGTA